VINTHPYAGEIGANRHADMHGAERQQGVIDAVVREIATGRS